MTADAGWGDPYALWDAAYVLGSLSSTQRREYEDHLAGCADCRVTVSEISGMPALLALLDRDDAAAGLASGEEQPAAPPLPPRLLASLLDNVGARRRRARWLTATVATVAAVIVAISVFVALRPGGLTAVEQPPGTTTPAMAMTPMVPSEYEASVVLSSHQWGTRIDMTCTYHSWSANGHDDEAGDLLAMELLGEDGSRTRLATWLAVPASTALPSASTSMRVDEIASVQVVAADTGDVLLQRSL